ncbi:hypothetical protein HMPREF3182_00919 [Megasphaera hutchinsoni]|uniref:Uncharacterized protein n=1 Tax=Megasphaera hutchinsoni TaxID=1588748 RepID=A0A134CF27_9FIRM|nr:hypothetical protein HMPREF3182_00919 [Megasphaera hutchinsoni]
MLITYFFLLRVFFIILCFVIGENGYNQTVINKLIFNTIKYIFLLMSISIMIQIIIYKKHLYKAIFSPIIPHKKEKKMSIWIVFLPFGVDL